MAENSPAEDKAQNGLAKNGPIKSDEEPDDTKAVNKIPDDDDSDVVRLKPKMGLLNGVTLIVGSIIGSGIFVSPTGVLAKTGSVGMSLVIWVLCGIFSMIGAYCYAELGCAITKTGADYAYIMDAFGPFLAFIRLWVECIIVRPCSQAIVALTFSLYALKPFYPTCDPPGEAKALLAAVCICVLTFVNCYDVKWATRVQDIFTYAKLSALGIIIGTGIVLLCMGNVEHFNFKDTETSVTTVGLSFYSGLFAYNGWNYLNFVIEELKDPQRNLPRAIAISCSIVTFVYTFTIVSFHTILNVLEVQTTPAVAVEFANRMFGVMAWLMPVFVAMSTFGGVNGILFTSSRLFYAGAEYGQMPEVLTMIQINRKTPAPAVLFMGILSMVYLSSTEIYELIEYVGFATWIAIGLGVAVLPYLRWKAPDLPRPIKVPLVFPIIYILASIFITVCPMIVKPVQTAYGALIIFSSVPVYFLFIYWKNRPQFLNSMSRGVTRCIQKVLIAVPTESPDDV